MAVQAVVFDIGETLLDDSREFGAWADWLGVPRHTFSAILGAVTAEGRNNAETFQYLRPGFDLAAERQRREKAGVGEQYGEQDTLAQALSCADAAPRKPGRRGNDSAVRFLTGLLAEAPETVTIASVS